MTDQDLDSGALSRRALLAAATAATVGIGLRDASAAGASAAGPAPMAAALAALTEAEARHDAALTRWRQAAQAVAPLQHRALAAERQTEDLRRRLQVRLASAVRASGDYADLSQGGASMAALSRHVAGESRRRAGGDAELATAARRAASARARCAAAERGVALADKTEACEQAAAQLAAARQRLATAQPGDVGAAVAKLSALAAGTADPLAALLLADLARLV